MIPTLGNVDAEAYASTFKEAQKLLRLRRIPGCDAHEISHAVVERYFLNVGNVTLTECLDQVLAEEIKPESPVHVEEATSGNTESLEATLDIYKIYLKVAHKFSGDEKLVFFSMLDENPLTGIADRLNMSQTKINGIKKAILEKIKNAVPGAKNRNSGRKASKE